MHITRRLLGMFAMVQNGGEGPRDEFNIHVSNSGSRSVGLGFMAVRTPAGSGVGSVERIIPSGWVDLLSAGRCSPPSIAWKPPNSNGRVGMIENLLSSGAEGQADHRAERRPGWRWADKAVLAQNNPSYPGPGQRRSGGKRRSVVRYMPPTRTAKAIIEKVRRRSMSVKPIVNDLAIPAAVTWGQGR